jgi:hypothetical protein
MASKFSTPFMAKSPLYGAYESGAGGKVYVSNRRAFEKLQDDIVSGTKSAIFGEKKTACEKGAKSFTKDGATYNCPSKESKNNNSFSFSDKIDISDITKNISSNTSEENYSMSNGMSMLGECPKGKVRSKINKKCVSKKGAGKEYDK